MSIWIGLALGASLLLGCAEPKSSKPPAPSASRSPTPSASNSPTKPIAEARRSVGLASYYAEELRGRPTASGERYDPAELTAAHRHYPFGTRVTVTNLENGKSVVVRINDRGPHKTEWIIDLSAAGAKELGLRAGGTVKVSLEVAGE
jgi:rare lipoprotein A